jgi:hypothetical protein
MDIKTLVVETIGELERMRAAIDGRLRDLRAAAWEMGCQPAPASQATAPRAQPGADISAEITRRRAEIMGEVDRMRAAAMAQADEARMAAGSAGGLVPPIPGAPVGLGGSLAKRFAPLGKALPGDQT